MPNMNDPRHYLMGFNHPAIRLDSDYSTKQNIIFVWQHITLITEHKQQEIEF